MCLRGSVFSVCSFCCNHLCESCFQVVQRFVDVFHFCVDACLRSVIGTAVGFIRICSSSSCRCFSKTFMYSIELNLFKQFLRTFPAVHPPNGGFLVSRCSSYRRQLTAPVIRVVDEAGTFVLSRSSALFAAVLLRFNAP